MMFRYAIIVLVLTTLVSFPVAAEEEVGSYEDAIFPLVEKYCLDCHDELSAKGDLNLERFETTEMVLDSIAIWDRIVKRLTSNEMPPRDELKPTPEERDAIIKWIESVDRNNLDCDHIASEQSVSWYPGYVMSRRLNRAEYQYTLGDLLGIDIEVSDMFPADGSGGEGFDNNGSALFLSAIQLEKYLEAADTAIEVVIPIIDEEPEIRNSSKIRTPAILHAKQRREANRSHLIPETPSRKDDPREVAGRVIHQFAERAWRRPVTDDETERLLTMFDRSFDRGDSFREAVKLAYKSVLISPNFLFLAEPEPAQLGDYMLGGYQLASRMSYFIWSSMPDAELIALAESGDLANDDVLRAQVQRMLRDPKSKALGEQFAMQWLGISQFAEITTPDEERFPEFTDGLAESMRQEAVLFFASIFQDDRSLLDLITADYTYANDALAELYGFEDVIGEDMRPVSITDPNRGGVVGMAAVLTETSHALRTSPVLRGKWVLNQLLGDHVPPPPPNVPTLPEDDHDLNGLSFRETLEIHRKSPECAGCHARMDPIGFGLENFDPIGRWRDTQAGLPIDTSGVLPSGEAFSGPAELKALLLLRKDQFATNLSRKMLGYALGRSLTRHDTCVINDSMEALKADEYRASNLVTEIVLSYPFRHRYSNGKT